MTKEGMFWQYFAREEEVIFKFEKDQKRVFARLTEELQKVHPDLTFEFGPVTEGARDFVISAGGVKKAFPAVEKLYGERPELKRFRVIKFRPRRKVVSDLNYGGLAIRGKDVYYHLVSDEEDVNKVGVLLFLPGYSKNKEVEFGNIGYLMLDEAIGEYAVETYISAIEMKGHDSPHFEGAHPIGELGDHFVEVISRKIPRTGPLH
jgi:hypothetical protein